MSVEKRKYKVKPAAYLAGVAVMFLFLLSVRRDLQASDTGFGDFVSKTLMAKMEKTFSYNMVPLYSFALQGEKGKFAWLEQSLKEMMSFYGYSKEMADIQLPGEHEDAYLSMEDIRTGELQYSQVEKEPFWKEDEVQEEQGQQVLADHEMQETLQELMIAENQMGFMPHTLQNPVDLQLLDNYEYLVKNFYTIDGNTMAGSDQLDVNKFISRDLSITKKDEGPQILIYHTHSQEGFADSIPGDTSTTIMGVGEQLSEILRKRYGYQVLHHMGMYDVESRNDAYSNALPDIERVLQENPSIEVVIDLHRDSMPEEKKLVMDLDGRPTARFMFFNGISRTKKTGNIAYLKNDNLEDNLAFSFQLNLKATEYYPGITRKIYLKGYRYNMHLMPRTTLIELGAQNNTVEEAMNACDPLAHIIDLVLSGEGRTQLDCVQ